MRDPNKKECEACNLARIMEIVIALNKRMLANHYKVHFKPLNESAKKALLREPPDLN